MVLYQVFRIMLFFLFGISGFERNILRWSWLGIIVKLHRNGLSFLGFSLVGRIAHLCVCFCITKRIFG